MGKRIEFIVLYVAAPAVALFWVWIGVYALLKAFGVFE